MCTIHTLGLRGWVFECTCMSKCLQWTGKTLLRGNVAFHGSLGESSLQRVGSRLGPWGPYSPTAYPTCLLNDSGNPTSRQTRVFSGPFAPGSGSFWLALLRNWESKVSIKVLLWYPYTLYVYDYDNMLWLHDMKICMIMYVYRGVRFCHFFLIVVGLTSLYS